MGKAKKETYEAPTLVDFGPIESLTKGRLPAGVTDAPQGTGNQLRPDDLVGSGSIPG